VTQTWAASEHHPAVMPPFLPFVITSVAATAIGKRHIGGLFPHLSDNYVILALELFIIQFGSWLFYKVFIYPFFINPLRHLPEPKVYLFYFLSRARS
jgi:hypothetical protein